MRKTYLGNVFLGVGQYTKVFVHFLDIVFGLHFPTLRMIPVDDRLTDEAGIETSFEWRIETVGRYEFLTAKRNNTNGKH